MIEEYCPSYDTGGSDGGRELRDIQDSEPKGLGDLLHWRVKKRRKSRMTPRT